MQQWKVLIIIFVVSSAGHLATPTSNPCAYAYSPNVGSVRKKFLRTNFFNSKKYFEIEQVKCTWKGFGEPIEVNSFRRPLHECIAPLTNNGFYIDALVEPKPTKEFEQIDPRHFKELNEFPAFMCIRAVKKAAV